MMIDVRTDKQLDVDFDKASRIKEQADLAMEEIRLEKSRRKDARIAKLRARMDAAAKA